MAKDGGIGKLGKLKCMMSKWHHGASRNNRRHGTSKDNVNDDDTWQQQESSKCKPPTSLPAENQKVTPALQVVYVGKSRRRYLISSHLIDHPLFRVLVQKSGDGEETNSVVIGCEVVLFEHLLWMLENVDTPPETVDEIVDFYAC